MHPHRQTDIQIHKQTDRQTHAHMHIYPKTSQFTWPGAKKGPPRFHSNSTPLDSSSREKKGSTSTVEETYPPSIHDNLLHSSTFFLSALLCALHSTTSPQSPIICARVWNSFHHSTRARAHTSARQTTPNAYIQSERQTDNESVKVKVHFVNDLWS